ncbi:probable gluconokinase isoform X1 [Anguilla anguilla]|uniref:probable gluconokinase isoform X1 n=2 Tax=Anguilla anguilla TaxID=7936 RepID=UPI0015AE9E5A|nr:probable gluconokinase isoform X1 [Anguilla anguilla]
MILIIMGVSGSGKSTVGSLLSEKLGWTLYEGDDYHPKENIEKMASGIPLTDQDRTPWLLLLHDIIQREMAAGTNAILVCSALKKLYRQLLLFGRCALDGGGGAGGGAGVGDRLEGVLFAFLQGSFQLIQERVQARGGHFMPPSLLRSQFDTLEPPSPAENALALDIRDGMPEIAAEIERALSAHL